MSISGDIWNTGAFVFDSPLKDLLDSLEFTLEDLLNEDELLQELRGEHPQLVQFFSTEDSVAGLIKCLIRAPFLPKSESELSLTDEKQQDDLTSASTLVTDEKDQTDRPAGHDNDSHEEEVTDSPSGDDTPWLLQNTSEPRVDQSSMTQLSPAQADQEEDDTTFIRYPYMACEVICCEIDPIISILVEGRVVIGKDAMYQNAFKLYNRRKDVDDNGANNDFKIETETISILDLLFSIVHNTTHSQLDDRRAGYLEKILTILFRKKPNVMAAYMNGEKVEEDEDARAEREIADILNNTDDTDDERANSSTTGDRYNFKGGGISLLRSFSRQLHSHSIMRIVQRLLMPRPPSLKNNEGKTNKSNSNDDKDWSGVDDDDDDDDDDENGDLILGVVDGLGIINCNWNNNDATLSLLLDLLYGDSCDNFDGDEGSRLDTSQHASEILVTIIQNSPLSSKIITKLTQSNELSRLVKCCNGIPHGAKNLEQLTFSRHESSMTTAMSVLETLVLQLGGYGSVDILTPKENDDGKQVDMDQESGTLYNGTTCSSPIVSEIDEDQENHAKKELSVQLGNEDSHQSACDIASPKHSCLSQSRRPEVLAKASSLIDCLPLLLSSLSRLLTHPDTQTWESPVQYSSKPQNLLGASRLKIIRVLESLVLLGLKEVDHILCTSDCLEICIDLFWEFTWCSMLHQSVANLLVHVLEGGEERVELQHYFLFRCDLPRRLINSFEVLEEEQTDGTPITDVTSTTNDVDGVELAVEHLTADDDDSHLSESMLALDGYKTDATSSSQESTDAERGSLSSEDYAGLSVNSGDDDAIPVSEDDVDAALEQEEQMGRFVTHEIDRNEIGDMNDSEDKSFREIGDLDGNAIIASSVINSTPKDKDIDNKLPFRMGYMGHIIIICQSLDHACGIEDKSNNESDGHIEVDLEAALDESNLSSSLEESQVLSTNLNEEADVKHFNSDELFQEQDKSHNQPTCSARPPISSFGEQPNILNLLQQHSLYSQWNSFRQTTLASETAVQNSSLGSFNIQNESTANEDSHDGFGMDGDYSGEESTFDEVPNNEMEPSFVVNNGDFDLDDTDLDIAASMMESMSLQTSGDPTFSEENESGFTNNRHHRQRGVIAGQGAGNGNVADFGTVVQMHQKPGEYLYDDPLGGARQFSESEDSIDDDFPEFEENSKSQDDENDSNDDVPVMNLFAGNFNFDDALATSNGEENEDTAWANFDDAFSASADAEPSNDNFPSAFSGSNEDFFDQGNESTIIDSSDARNVFEVESQKSFNLVKSFANVDGGMSESILHGSDSTAAVFKTENIPTEPTVVNQF